MPQKWGEFIANCRKCRAPDGTQAFRFIDQIVFVLVDLKAKPISADHRVKARPLYKPKIRGRGAVTIVKFALEPLLISGETLALYRPATRREDQHVVPRFGGSDAIARQCEALFLDLERARQSAWRDGFFEPLIQTEL